MGGTEYLYYEYVATGISLSIGLQKSVGRHVGWAAYPQSDELSTDGWLD